MSSGLYFVVLVNLVVTILGLLFYRYVILTQIGLLTPQEVRLLRKYPPIPAPRSYTPTDAFVRAPPPMRWTTFTAFFTASEAVLSRDAQVYFLFQRACIVTTAICAFVSTVVLLPCYWYSGALFQTNADKAPSLFSLLKSDRGVFERFTSHNLPTGSPLLLLQLPVILITALCIIVLYTVVKAAAGEQKSLHEWLKDNPTHSPALKALPSSPYSPNHRTKGSQWTLFARGLPPDLKEADELAVLLEALCPGQVVKVELVCKGKMSEARLLRTLSSAQNRLEYLYQIEDDPQKWTANLTLLGRFLSLFRRRKTPQQMISQLEGKIETLQSEFREREAQPLTDFTGCAFITLRSPTATVALLRDFPVRFENPNVNEQDMSQSQMTIGRHARMRSEWRVPTLRNLYKGTVSLLPTSWRDRIHASSRFAPMQVAVQSRAQATLLAALPEDEHVITPEEATAKLKDMKAARAPKSGDIIWRNIGISFFERTVREIIVQVIVFAALILFTSPVAMLTALKLVFAELALLSDPHMIFNPLHHNSTASSGFGLQPLLNETDGFDVLNVLNSGDTNAALSISNDLLEFLPSFLTSNTVMRSAILGYLPVLLLAVVFAIVPSLLRLTCSLEGYETYSAQEMSVFRKTSFYYVMNAVVLPSLALNTASEFLEMVYKQSGGGANVYNALPILQRLFSGDIAFFLCNYLVQLALTGSVLWLLRLPNSFSMIFRRNIALTPLEVAEAKCTDIFDYPRHYAYNVTVMSSCLLFGYMAPLMWYFALIYFVCKHAVDVYTIRYVHPRTHIDGRLPRLSANFILIWTTVSQLSVAVIFYLQGWVKAGIATAFLCLITNTACLSVSTHMGNRLLSIVAGWRDRAIDWVLRKMNQEYEWMNTSLIESSSSSSSTQSLPDARETDSLIIKDPMIRRLSMQIGSLNHMRSNSIRLTMPDVSSLRPNSSMSSMARSVMTDDSEIDAEFIDNEDIESALQPKVIPQYGTCEGNGLQSEGNDQEEEVEVERGKQKNGSQWSG